MDGETQTPETAAFLKQIQDLQEKNKQLAIRQSARGDLDLVDVTLTIAVAGIASGIAYMVGNFVGAFVTAVTGASSAFSSIPYNLLLGAGVFAGLGFMEIRKVYREWKAAQL